MLWLEDKQQLITCAKDKTVKIWSFPTVWYDEEEVKAKLGILPKKPQTKVEPEYKQPPVKEESKVQKPVNLDNPLAPPLQ
jgi:WD40 repeat protein